MVSRYLVERGPDQVKIAFKGIVQLCQSNGIGSVTLVVPKKDGWDRTVVGEFLGADAAKALLKGGQVEIADGVEMTLVSAQTFRPYASPGLLVGAHISIKDMGKLDDSFGAKAVMYLPWTETEDQEWRKTWGPEVVGPTTQTTSPSSLPKPVEEALRQLTGYINLGTGLGHPSDKKQAERVMAQLKADGHVFDPADIRRWAQRNGWSSHAAKDLEKIAQKRW